MDQKYRSSRPALTRRQWLGQSLKLGAGLGLGSGGALSLAGCAGGGGGQVPAMSVEEVARRMPELARQLQQQSGVPGLAWAVVQGEQLVAAQGLGVRELERSGAVDADTVFQLASMSKPLGATVVARQVGEGRVRWDSRMQELLPWFALSDADSTARVTVADMYSHRSGLPDHAGDLLEELGYSQREVFERLRRIPVKPLRTAYAYTNAGLTAAAVGVAGAAGTDWATLSHAAVYAPLGMARTTSVHAQFMQQANRATGHVRGADGRWSVSTPRQTDVLVASGGASSSVNDMARWMGLVLGQGLWQGRRLIAPQAFAPVLQPQAPGGHYGFGFNVSATESGLAFFGHSGAFLRAATNFTVVPSYNAGIVVLTNGQPLGVPETLCRQFLDLMENGRFTRDWWAAYSEAMQDMLKPGGSLVGKTPPAQPESAGPLALLAGRYHSDYYGPLQVTLADGALQLALGTRPDTYALRHWTGRQFVFMPVQESASPGTVSLAEFAPPASEGGAAVSLRLEFFDAEGLGTFRRRA